MGIGLRFGWLGRFDLKLQRKRVVKETSLQPAFTFYRPRHKNKMQGLVKNIITIQHTESVHHTNGMIGSWTDWDLSEKGKAQAENIGKNLAKELRGTHYNIYASTLLRAKQTAQIIGQHLHAEVDYTEALKERNLGSAIGKSGEWFQKNLEMEEYTIDDRYLHDAESRRDVWSRLFPFYQEILNNKDENIILISHGDTLSIFNAIWLKLEPAFLNHGNLAGESGGVSFLHIDHKGKHVIAKLSDMSYLR
jgi:broad specificity phosphatase PhoE